MTNVATPNFRTILAAIRATPMALRSFKAEAGPPARPFITISREGGAGGHTLGRHLVARLNELDPREEPWSLWDKELVEKVATDHHISKELIETLESSHKPWMQEFLSALSMQDDIAQTRIYHGVAATIRTLALHGRVVIVGRGGAFITRQMPGGTHIRLVAPMECRIQTMAKQLNLSRDAAAEHVRQLDRERAAFYKRYWPKDVCTPEAFTLTINMADIDEKQVAESIAALVLPGSQMMPAPKALEVINAGAAD